MFVVDDIDLLDLLFIVLAAVCAVVCDAVVLAVVLAAVLAELGETIFEGDVGAWRGGILN